MFKSEQCADFFYVLYKRARKWGGIPTGITQNVDDLLQSKNARTMLSNTKFIIMLSQNPTDSEVLSEILKIPSETMDYVTNSGVGRGLIFAGEYGNIPFDIRLPKNSNIYQIVSTAFAEKLDDVPQDEKAVKQGDKSTTPIPERPWEVTQGEDTNDEFV
jgi:type IV secretory pathway VirB4 component